MAHLTEYIGVLLGLFTLVGTNDKEFVNFISVYIHKALVANEKFMMTYFLAKHKLEIREDSYLRFLRVRQHTSIYPVLTFLPGSRRSSYSGNEKQLDGCRYTRYTEDKAIYVYVDPEKDTNYAKLLDCVIFPLRSVGLYPAKKP